MENEERKLQLKKQVDRKWVHTLLARYLEGEASEKEKQVVETWMPEVKEGTETRHLEEMIAEDQEQIWERLADMYGVIETPQTETLPLQKEFGVKRLFSLRKYAAVVAVVLLVAGSAFYFMDKKESLPFLAHQEKSVRTIYETGEREVKKISLPDGSIVHLNGNTRLSLIDNEFNKKNREIRLEEGEAFFEVTKNKDKPFVVYSHHLQTTVRGTSFNVKAYGELGEDVVAVKTGIVEVNAGSKKLQTLIRNQQLSFQAGNGHVVTDEINADEFTAWTEGRLVLSKATIKELKLRLKQHFGVELEQTGEILDNALFNSTYPAEVSLQDVMEDICLIYGVQYKQQGKRLIILDR